MRSALSLLAPILTPTMPPAWARAASRRSTRSAPSLLKPSRLITAWSRSSRNRRGRGLPICGCGVTVPTSTKPKPSRSRASGTSAFLSKPAAIPTGLGKLSPKARTASLGSSAVSFTKGGIFSAAIASRCASSASSNRNSGRASDSNRPITVQAPETSVAHPRPAAAAFVEGRQRARARLARRGVPRLSFLEQDQIPIAR